MWDRRWSGPLQGLVWSWGGCHPLGSLGESCPETDQQRKGEHCPPALPKPAGLTLSKEFAGARFQSLCFCCCLSPLRAIAPVSTMAHMRGMTHPPWFSPWCLHPGLRSGLSPAVPDHPSSPCLFFFPARKRRFLLQLGERSPSLEFAPSSPAALFSPQRFTKRKVFLRGLTFSP